MANRYAAGLHCDLSSNFKYRWSAPCYPSRTYSQQSKDQIITSFEFGGTKPLYGTTATIVESSGGSSSTTSSLYPNKREFGQWRRSFLRVGPLVGLAALLLALLQIFASFTVLELSDGQPTQHWKFGPSVYIAILTTISDGAIQFAATEGAVITFWLRLVGGTTLGQLHRDFTFGSEFWYALRAGRHLNLLAIACISATLVCIDGPLLQRASSTHSINYQNPVNLNISLVPEVPAYFSGFYDRSSDSADFTSPMLDVMNQYSSKVPITDGIKGCSGTCYATVRAAALVVHHYESSVIWKNFSAPLAANESYRELYSISLTTNYGSSETLDLHTYLTGDEVAKTCAGPVNSTHYYLRSAIAEYDVQVTNKTIVLMDPANPRFISWANNTAITDETIEKFGLRHSAFPGFVKTTLAGIVDAFNYEFEFYGVANPPTSKVPGVLDILATQGSLFKFQHTTNYEQFVNNKACSYAWKEVQPGVMAGLNELMFRIGVHVAKNYDDASLSLKDALDTGVQINYTTIGSQHRPTEVFRSDFAFFAAAAAIDLLTIALVLSTFYGYWRLGRDVSFSPLELAKAFGAPLLARLASNLSGSKIALAMGGERIKYGILRGEDEYGGTTEVGRLIISNSKHVEPPDSTSMWV